MSENITLSQEARFKNASALFIQNVKHIPIESYSTVKLSPIIDAQELCAQ